MSRSKPPYHKQETRFSCVPACLRMVLGSFGTDIREDELRRLCDCTTFGTDALLAVEAVRGLGFARSAKYTLTLDELKSLVAYGDYPIVFVDMNPIDGIDDIHAMVVVSVSDHHIEVLDPVKGERSLPLYVFNMAWAKRHNLAIVVER